MTAETAAPASELIIAACPNCGTLYRVSEERKWCPACSTDAGAVFDLGAILETLDAVSDGLNLLIGALASGLRVEPADVLDVLPKALETLVTPSRAGQERISTRGGLPTGSRRPDRRHSTPAPPAAEDAQESPPETAAAEPSPGPGADVVGDASNAAAVSPSEE